MPLDARLELAPTGTLRVGINFGNAVLVKRGVDGVARGIAVDLAAELAGTLKVPVEFVTYASAGRMADGAKDGAWDVAFLAADPDRSNEITFSAPYLEIETTYLVREDAPMGNVLDVDRDGVRIAVSARSAYDLFLARNLRFAHLVRAAGPDASAELFFKDHLDALAGIRPMLVEIARDNPGTRVLDGRFSVVQQAVGTPRGRDGAAQYVRDFVEEIKASGFVAKTIEKNGILGVTVLL
jgi:polar amino acid transport system substrate-binding protein